LGRPSRTTLGPLVANLAAAVSWGDWRSLNSDLQLPTTPGTAELRAALRRGQFRRKEPAGAAAGVRVLDDGALSGPPGQPNRGSGSSPAPHVRRGHRRRQRIGPRGSWHYEPRWIPPSFVTGTGTPGGTVKVYRLPVPPSGPASSVDTGS
jgi:hypothetical protein